MIKLRDLLKEIQATYTIPQDKETLLYDFYMLNYLDSLIKKKTVATAAGEYEEDLYPPKREDRNLDFSVEHAVDTLYPYLKKELLHVVFYAICAEIRHVFDRRANLERTAKGYEDLWTTYARTYDFHIKSVEQQDFLTKVYKIRKPSMSFPYPPSEIRNESARNYSFRAAKKAIIKTGKTDADFVQMCKSIFDSWSWDESYGGEAWSDICTGWLSLNNASSKNDMAVAIDHIYDLQHNNDTVFDKVMLYYKEGYDWIKKALDFKANLRSRYELLDKISPSMKKLALAVLHNRLGADYESYLKANPSAVNKKHKLPPIPKVPGTPTLLKQVLHKKDDSPWHGDTWYNGIWQDGEWDKGIWKDGIWENGIWKSGTWKNGDWKGGVWHSGLWENGVWMGGVWKSGTWKYGTWWDGLWTSGVWEGGVWKGGIWQDGRWDNGIWEGGKWTTGLWRHGKWEDGWIYDPNKEGLFEKDWQWDKGFVNSPIDPSKYWEEKI
jgi:hypothetical protein